MSHLYSLLCFMGLQHCFYVQIWLTMDGIYIFKTQMPTSPPPLPQTSHETKHKPNTQGLVLTVTLFLTLGVDGGPERVLAVSTEAALEVIERQSPRHYSSIPIARDVFHLKIEMSK